MERESDVAVACHFTSRVDIQPSKVASGQPFEA